MRFPISRLRRLRNNAVLRDMVAETRLSIKELIYPLFVHYGQGIRRPVESMPGLPVVGGSAARGDQGD